jgi:hypothetical protein
VRDDGREVPAVEDTAPTTLPYRVTVSETAVVWLRLPLTPLIVSV